MGVVEAGMADIAPASRCIHLTHDVPPQDVRAGSFALAYALPWLPTDAVVWAVVDPGVGTDRRAVAVDGRLRDRNREQHVTLVAPDNGLLTEMLARLDVSEAIALDQPRYHGRGGSTTFHGRDVFGPAAAWLAHGKSLASLGTTLDPASLCRIELPGPQRVDGGWRGTVRWVDRFGDLVTDLPASLLEQGPWVATVGTERTGDAAGPIEAPPGSETRTDAPNDVAIGTTFRSVEPGEAVAYGGSWGTVEVAVRDGNAAERFRAGLDTHVELRPAAI